MCQDTFTDAHHRRAVPVWVDPVREDLGHLLVRIRLLARSPRSEPLLQGYLVARLLIELSQSLRRETSVRHSLAIR